MHPAHPTVGVRGEGIVLGPFGRVDGLSIDRLVAAPLHVALVAYQPDADTRAAMALFEQAVDGRSDLRCGRVEMNASDAGSSRLADADCIVVFGRELQVLCPAMDAAAAARAASGSRTDYERQVPLEIEPVARWHPVLEGVEPFVSLHGVPEGDDMPEDATLLLSCRSHGACQPVAWLHCRYGRAFHTRLGSVADFHQPDFIRVLLNAAGWVGCP
jgi:hypothetical protein